MSKWRYDFECGWCGNMETVNGEVYCKLLRMKMDPMHADEDYVLRCDGYEPMQTDLWKEDNDA